MSTATAARIHGSRRARRSVLVALAAAIGRSVVLLLGAGFGTTRSAPPAPPTATASVGPAESDVANAVGHHSPTLRGDCGDQAVIGHC